MNGKSKKVIETENFVDDYIKLNEHPPTYVEIQKHFNLSNCAAWHRCEKFRDKMRTGTHLRRKFIREKATTILLLEKAFNSEPNEHGKLILELAGYILELT